ncbi:MAG TPA: sugar transferase [Candidatus Peribacteria bacterium]|nr:sugar transferase [Candidatus Peribacteria bacterium]
MKYSEILFGVLRVPLDALAALAALLLAYRLREANIDLLPGVQVITQPSNLPAFSYYLQTFVLPWTAVYIALIAALRLYHLRITLGAWNEMGRVIVASGIWLMIVIAWFFLVEKQLFFSRALLLQATVLLTIFAMAGRAAVILLQRACVRRGIGVRTVVSLGGRELPGVMHEALRDEQRFRYIGHLSDLDGLKRLEGEHHIDLILHTDPLPSGDETGQLINYCRSHHIGYSFLPPVFVDSPHQLSMDRLGLVPLLRFEPTPLDGWGRVWKRLFDIVGGVTLLVILSPLMLLVAIAVLVTSGWPVFYLSKRVGQHGNCSVPVLKFRTMIRDADARKKEFAELSHRDGPLFKVQNDPRVTPIGRLLRRWSVDEFPQLFNVIAGQLSLVGPRPHLPDEVQQYREDQRRVFAVRPGVTGLAQVSGRSNLKFDDEVRFDMQYIEEWSLALDVWILWRTVFVVLWGKGAD